MLLFDLLGSNEAKVFFSPIVKEFGSYERSDHDDSFHIIFNNGLEFLFELNDDSGFSLETIFLDNCDFINQNIDNLLGIDCLSFETSEEGLNNIFGEPKKCGGGGKGLLGNIPKWVKFQYNLSSIHFQFRELDNSIEKITIAPK